MREGPGILRLDDFAALRISGEDRREFLQGQLSQDMARVTAARAAPAAWCNRQGRVLCLMVTMEWADSTWLVLPAGMADSCAAGLGRFILRAKVRIEPAEGPVFGCTGADTLLALVPGEAWACVSTPGYCAVRLPGGSARALLLGDPPIEAAAASNAGWTPEQWRLADIKAELPWVSEKTSGKFLAHSLNLDISGAVSFTKGCYVGQEIIARMEYRGTPKRRMRRLQLPLDANAEPGGKVNDPELGTATIIVSAEAENHVEALAEVRLASNPADSRQP